MMTNVTNDNYCKLDNIPRCLECNMIADLLLNDIPENLRIYCKDCKIVWLLPSNYFEDIPLNIVGRK